MASAETFSRLIDDLVAFDSTINILANTMRNAHGSDVQKQQLSSIWTEIQCTYSSLMNAPGTQEEVKNNFRSQYTQAFQTYVSGIAKVNELGCSAPTFQRHNNNSPYRNPSDNTSISDVGMPHHPPHEGFHPQGSSSPHTTDTRPAPSNIPIPAVEIEYFQGDYAKWPSFRDVFTALVINNTRLAGIERLFHLRTRTRGEANEIVSLAPLTNDGFPIAWKSLSDRYENKRVLITQQINQLLNTPKMTTESSVALRNTQRKMNSCIQTLTLLGETGADAFLIVIGVNSLSTPSRVAWEDSLRDKKSMPKWEEFDAFLLHRYQTLEAIGTSGATSTPSATRPRPHYNQVTSLPTAANPPQNAQKCPMCNKNNHKLRHCPKFASKSVSERKQLVEQWHLCYNCFAPNHNQASCSSKFSCSICQARHNTLLHENQVSLGNRRPQLPSGGQPVMNAHARKETGEAHHTNAAQVLLGTARVLLMHEGSQYPARALLDNGSEATFITERLRKRLNLPFRKVRTQVSGIADGVPVDSNKKCMVTLASTTNPPIQFSTDAIILPHLLGEIPIGHVAPNQRNPFPSLPLADPEFYKSAPIDILLGSDILPFLMKEGMRRKEGISLLAQQTVFGWIITGPITKGDKLTCRVHSVQVNNDPCEAVLQRFWELEEVPREKPRSEDEVLAESLFRKTHKRDTNGRFVVHLPFRSQKAQNTLGESRSKAVACYLSNERRLSKTPHVKEDYAAVLREYLTLKQMKIATKSACPTYFLPHHAVLKPSSTTTKLRVVFNASSPTASGVSLNDTLLPGPALQADLPGLLTRWRFFQYVFNADIEKMYRQIRVTKEHTPFQRILLRDPRTQQLQTYELQTVTFGVNCAPFLAIRTLHALAEDVATTLPLASTVLTRFMYVDDALGGAHDLEEALITRDQLIEALNSAKFHLRKWTANNSQLLVGIPADDLLNEDFLLFEDSSQTKTLGIEWNARTDSFQFQRPSDFKLAGFTKRQVLSQIARLFDPVGWLAPIVILAKILMQDVWRSQIAWDEPLTPACQHRWIQFLENYPAISEIRIPRWIQFTPQHAVQLHGFCDASEKAYAAVIYARISASTSISSHLLLSKTRVAPVKVISIPRLELAGAVLLAELVSSLLPQLEVATSDIHFWTDSEIVLAWLRKPPAHWSTFVANRVSRISESVGIEQWHHVPTTDNPADIATRGMYPSSLAQNKLWWNGPTWLSKSASAWPQDIPQHQEIEARKIVAVASKPVRGLDVLLSRFSSFPRALRVCAYICRFIHRCRPQHVYPMYSELEISHEERKRTLTMLTRTAQQQYFPREYKSLKDDSSLPNDSTLKSLNPFLDSDGILRVSGRLIHCPTMTYDEKHPIILPPKHQITSLYVQFLHQVSLHGESQLMLRLLRLRYWIPQAKSLIRSVIHSCKPCLLYRKKAQQQLMGSLPSARVDISRPFLSTGMDFTGPFDVRSSPFGRKNCFKCYVCVFVCFNTRAIHLEATTDLSTQAFLAAFHRFISRRGCPSDVYTDNGTTFVGASRKLIQQFQLVVKTVGSIPGVLQQPIWHFIPPGAPHMGGLWEAAVKSFKTHFKKLASNIKYTFEEFSTLLARIEACLNSRPISALSDDPEDLGTLTPGHFLTSGPLLAPMDPVIEESPISISNRWHRLRAVQQAVCRRWKDDYLYRLHQRQKWQTPSDNLSINDLVVIRDTNLPINEWRMGRVVQVFPGSDNLVRVADLRTQKGVIRRPIHKLIRLPTNEQEPPSDPIQGQVS